MLFYLHITPLSRICSTNKFDNNEDKMMINSEKCWSVYRGPKKQTWWLTQWLIPRIHVILAKGVHNVHAWHPSIPTTIQRGVTWLITTCLLCTCLSRATGISARWNLLTNSIPIKSQEQPRTFDKLQVDEKISSTRKSIILSTIVAWDPAELARCKGFTREVL